MNKKPYVIGLDLGGTNSVFGIVDKNATIVTGSALKHTLARRVDITFEYHILYISTGLHNS